MTGTSIGTTVDPRTGRRVLSVRKRGSATLRAAAGRVLAAALA